MNEYKNKSFDAVLITGGAGFIGVNLIHFLLKKTNWKLNILDNMSNANLDEIHKMDLKNRVSLIEGDIRSSNDVTEAIEGCSYVVHLAAQTGVIPSIKNPINDAEINVLGTVNLLKIASENRVKRVVLASSAAPLGEQIPPLNEQKIPHPLAPYGASKLACEGYASAFSKSFGLRTITLRFSNVYGPRAFRKGSVVAKFIKQILNNEPVSIYGDGNQTRDLIYTDDICNAIYLSLTSNHPGKSELFQVGTGVETSVNKIFEIIENELSDYNIRVKDAIYKPPRAGEITRNYSEISKIKSKLGFSPSTNLEKGIQKTVQWFIEKNNEVKERG